jgi:hypothetical protein
MRSTIMAKPTVVSDGLASHNWVSEYLVLETIEFMRSSMRKPWLALHSDGTRLI